MITPNIKKLQRHARFFLAMQLAAATLSAFTLWLAWLTLADPSDSTFWGARGLGISIQLSLTYVGYREFMGAARTRAALRAIIAAGQL